MDLDRILKELHAERQWLETIISALEVAALSPAEQFTSTLVRELNGERSSRRTLYLGPRKKMHLARLAGQVRKTRHHPPASRRVSAAERTLDLDRASSRNVAA
ncbi:MAG: hypothetical protein HY236_09225 [Acidobacteria bacterium]|nr:hypothetical protein [Acidobacteriota bacterium]